MQSYKLFNFLNYFAMWNWILFIVIGAVAGWLAGQIMKGRGFGFLYNLIIGIVGGVIGGWIFGFLKITAPGGAIIGGLISAVVGAIVLLFVISLFKKK